MSLSDGWSLVFLANFCKSRSCLTIEFIWWLEFGISCKFLQKSKLPNDWVYLMVGVWYFLQISAKVEAAYRLSLSDGWSMVFLANFCKSRSYLTIEFVWWLEFGISCKFLQKSKLLNDWVYLMVGVWYFLQISAKWYSIHYYSLFRGESHSANFRQIFSVLQIPWLRES